MIKLRIDHNYDGPTFEFFTREDANMFLQTALDAVDFPISISLEEVNETDENEDEQWKKTKK